METTTNQQINIDKIGQIMTQKLKKVICEREFANMITQTAQQLMDVNNNKKEDEPKELDASQELFQKLNNTVYDGELVNDNTELNLNILMQIRTNIEDQISTRTNDINFSAFINNCIPDDSLTSEVNDVIQHYLILFQEERLKNEIKMLKSYLNMLNEKIHSLCEHTFVSDCIDIDPDTSVKIYYCTVCKVSDLNDKIRMIQEKCCSNEKCADKDNC
jgi:hypothetical protein